MMDATRLDTDLGNWTPVARHYQVPGGHLVVVVHNLLTATGTDVFYADEQGGPYSMEAIKTFPDGTSHDEALESLGYTVIDEIGPEPQPDPTPETTTPQGSVLAMLPPEIASMLNAET